MARCSSLSEALWALILAQGLSTPGTQDRDIGGVWVLAAPSF